MPAPKHPVLIGSTSILEGKVFLFYLNSSSILYSLIYVISNESVLSFSNLRASDGCFSTLVVRTHSEISTLGGCSWWVSLRCFTMFAHVTCPEGESVPYVEIWKTYSAHTHTHARTHAHTHTHTHTHTQTHTHTHAHTDTHMLVFMVYGRGLKLAARGPIEARRMIFCGPLVDIKV